MSLTAEQQALFDTAKEVLPAWFFDTDRANEYLAMAAGIMAASRSVTVDWLDIQTHILTAEGPGPTWPDFLAEHARDRGTSRQDGENDDALRLRIRSYPDALTRPAILTAAQRLLDLAGVSGSAAMVELPRDGIFYGTHSAETGVGGVFTKTGSLVTFTPTVQFRTVPFVPVPPQFGRQLSFSGAAAGGNNGNYVTSGVAVDGAQFTNAAGVAGTDLTVAWTIHRLDRRGNRVDGFARGYYDRGYRYGSLLPVFILILPFGTPDGVFAAITEVARQLHGAGVIVRIERREVP